MEGCKRQKHEFIPYKNLIFRGKCVAQRFTCCLGCLHPTRVPGSSPAPLLLIHTPVMVCSERQQWWLKVPATEAGHLDWVPGSCLQHVVAFWEVSQQTRYICACLLNKMKINSAGHVLWYGELGHTLGPTSASECHFQTWLTLLLTQHLDPASCERWMTAQMPTHLPLMWKTKWSSSPLPGPALDAACIWGMTQQMRNPLSLCLSSSWE